MPIVYREEKGGPLTNTEVDSNFRSLDTKIDEQGTELDQKIDAQGADLQGQVNQKLEASEVGSSVAPLEGGKLPAQYIPDEMLTGLKFEDFWNAATNTPDLNAVTVPVGHFYIVSVPGTFGGVDYDVGNWAVKNKDGGWSRWTLTVPTDAVSQSIGTDPNQWPLVQMLGELAFMNRDQFVMALKAAATPHNVGDMVFQLTNDTTLVGKAKGSDGVVRSVTWTLA